MKNNRVRKIVIWLIVIATISLTIAFVAFVNTSNYKILLRSPNHNRGKTIDELRIMNMDNANNIYLTAVSSEIHIYASERSDIEIHFFGNSFFDCKRACPKLMTELTGDRINIKVEYPKMLFNYLDVALDVYIPRDYTGNIYTSNVSGKTWIENLDLEQCSCTTVSGDLKLKNISSKDLNLNTTSGNIFISDMTGNLQINSVSGDLDISYDIFSNFIDINTISGDVKINLPQDAEFILYIDTASGKVINKFLDFMKSSKKRNQPESIKNNVSIKTISGDISLNK